MTRKTGLIIFILLALFFAGPVFPQPAPLKIGVSKASPNYINWLRSADPSVVTVDLYSLPVDEAVRQLSQCSGLLLTGGEDVYPGRYGKEYDTVRCTEMNPHRDSLDMALIGKALTLKMPVVGVCRGHQITTNHHQAVEQLSPRLTANAFSSDHLIEGIEWLEPEGKSFLLGVQWHPERMDRQNPLSAAIADEFLVQATEYAHKP